MIDLNINKSDVIDIFLDLGFESIGIAPPVLDDIFKNNFKNWINLGYNGEMSWMEKNINCRTNVKVLHPWAKSVIVAGMNYYHFRKRKNGTAKISMHSWGKDYHAILYSKLKQALNRIRALYPKTIGKIYVDSGSILEKGYAVCAGLGWQGKNSIVVLRNVGSFYFLGVIVLNLSLQPDYITDDMCGNCTSCMDACPSGALVKPYLLDARKCISYLTVEKKSNLSKYERNWLNGWLYGCDICQEVCPWNKKCAVQTKENRFYNRLELLERSYSEWLELTEGQFRTLFISSSIKRLGFERFRRNLLALLE